MARRDRFDLSFLHDGSEMCRRIAAFDWSTTPLGPIESWPMPLLAAMKVMLLTQLPMYIAWGPDLTLIYNDAYAGSLSDKHPRAVGRALSAVWDAEAWKVIEPEIEQALAGRPYFVRDRPHPLGCSDEHATSYFTFSSVPLSDETGRVCGVFCAGYDTTAEVRERNGYKADSERLRDLFGQAPGFMHVLRGPDHVYEIVNNAYYRLVGDRQLVGRTVREALPEIEAQGYLDLLDQVYATGQPHVAYEASVKLRRTPDGPEDERILTFILQPIRDAKGAVAGIFVEGSDVTEAVRASARQKEIERLAHATIDALSEHIAVIDDRGTILAVNEAWRVFAEANGTTAAAVSEGSNYLAVCAEAAAAGDETAGEIVRLIGDVASGARPSAEMEYPCHAPDEERWFHVKITRFRDDGPTRLVISHENTTARRKSSERIEYLATHDALTGLPNRHLFEARAREAILQASRAGQGIALLLLNLDHFKHVNESYGHVVGDRVLVSVASVLAGIVHPNDMIARLGADELAIVLADLRDPAIDAGRVAHAIVQRLGSPLPLVNLEIAVTASIGISVFPGDGEDLEGLLKNADSAMRRAKAVGRAGYQFYAVEMSARANERRLLENDLRRAIRRNDLTVAYQPKICIHTGVTIGAEALVRWTHADLGEIGPSRFIPIAEDAGLIGEIGRFVLRTACRDARSWHVPMPVAVNVSAAQLWHVDFVDIVDDVLSESGLDPTLLELEITEGMMMEPSEFLLARLNKLRQLGLSLTIDDFGTGYSNLRYLQTFRLSRLKIDRWFVGELCADANAAAIVRAIVALGRSLGLKVLAEGVETVAQEAMLRDMGCEEAQGFLYSRPLSLEVFQRRLRDEMRRRPPLSNPVARQS